MTHYSEVFSTSLRTTRAIALESNGDRDARDTLEGAVTTLEKRRAEIAEAHGTESTRIEPVISFNATDEVLSLVYFFKIHSGVA